MTWQIPSSVTSTGIAVSLGTSDDVFVAPNAVIASTENQAIRGTGSNHHAIIYGTVIGSSIGFFTMHIGDSGNLDQGARIEVKAGGQVHALDVGAAIACYAYGSEIINDGIVSSISGAGIVLRGSSAATTSLVVNTGTIEGHAGITRFGVDAVGETIEIRNSGLISGKIAAYTLFASEGGAAKDLITNTGKIVGAVNLFGGDDLYDGAKGYIDGEVNAGAGNDQLHGGKENNVLRGDGGADTLTGGLGADELSGGSGADHFIFLSLSDSRTKAAKRDAITDFSSSEGDEINLVAIDAVSSAKGNQAFDFIGNKAFSGDAGELRYTEKAGDTWIMADSNGDRKADFVVKLDGMHDLGKGDFIL